MVTRLSNGDNLRNLGHRVAEGQRWCRVATLADPRAEGWVAGDFHVEGTATGANYNAVVNSGENVMVQFSSGERIAEMAGTLDPDTTRR